MLGQNTEIPKLPIRSSHRGGESVMETRSQGGRLCVSLRESLELWGDPKEATSCPARRGTTVRGALRVEAGKVKSALYVVGLQNVAAATTR